MATGFEIRPYIDKTWGRSQPDHFPEQPKNVRGVRLCANITGIKSFILEVKLVMIKILSLGEYHHYY